MMNTIAIGAMRQIRSVQRARAWARSLLISQRIASNSEGSPRAVSDAGAVPLTDGRSALIVGGYRGHALAQVLRLRMTG